jgi:LacI family transcriptional regulator
MQATVPTKLAIAKAVGVSRTCVSQVLNQIPNARISPETRKRIMEEAQRRGYIGSTARQPHATSRGILYAYCHRQPQYKPSISHLWTHVVQWLHQLCSSDDRYVVVSTTSIDAVSLERFFRSLDNIRPMAVILDGVVPNAILAELQRRNIPHVVFGTASDALDETRLAQTNTVHYDYDEVMGNIMKWFYSRGCRRIAFSCGLLRNLVHSTVFDAYRNWVDRLNLEFDPALVQFGEDATGAEIFSALGRLGIQHDGIILASVSRAARALPFLPPPARGANRMRPVAVLGAPDASTDWISDMAVAGPRCQDVAVALYELICSELNYQTKKKKHILVPTAFVEAT